MACKNCGQSHAIGMACGKVSGAMPDKAVNTERVPKGTSTPKVLKTARKPARIK